MKAMLASLALAVALFAPAAAQDNKPINAKCPVMTEKAAKASITTTYEGKTIGFC